MSSRLPADPIYPPTPAVADPGQRSVAAAAAVAVAVAGAVDNFRGGRGVSAMLVG